MSTDPFGVSTEPISGSYPQAVENFMKIIFTDLDIHFHLWYGGDMSQRELALEQLALAEKSSSISFQANAIAAAHVRALLHLADVLASAGEQQEG